MPKLSPRLRTRLIVVAVLVVAAAIGGVVLSLQHQERQRRSALCRQQRVEISRFRRDGFDAPLGRMREMRLNPEQAATLRRVDPEAYARYAQAFGDQVDRVAQAADRLAAMVDAYRNADCLGLE